ncbi:hypothetical protein M0R04_09275 [Candidatus Dojkabacteria bacterium]|jgi:hypothetical protein|nr:hypothetical protein [Candidatus Dojkabacteria bacterium]
MELSKIEDMSYEAKFYYYQEFVRRFYEERENDAFLKLCKESYEIFEAMLYCMWQRDNANGLADNKWSNIVKPVVTKETGWRVQHTQNPILMGSYDLAYETLSNELCRTK